MSTATTGRGGFAALDACVHCGFCLQACPTFLATGDEADGPRGRIELMRAMERGDLSADDPSLILHLDRCLACRGCEPVCPSGVGYGHALETARERIAERRGIPWFGRAVLWATTAPGVSRVVYAFARALRATGLPARLAGWGRLGFGMGMLAATRADGRMGGWAARKTGTVPSANPPIRPSAALLFRGCVMDGLFSHVHEATIRTLTVNGYDVSEVPGQGCCGALHAHAGLHAAAQEMARINVAAFPGDAAIVVNSAGCGAMLKDYGRLLPEDPAAARFAARVRDVTELLAERGPRQGAPLRLRVAYDAPCHLLHAQRIATPPRQVLDAIPGLQWSETADSAQCCGSAGLYSALQPALSRTVLLAKLERLRADPPDVLATGNPGCAMQLGAGLRAARLATTVLHPVELLDASYREAGL
jgi:glycolate oxidase iron-sulfur subunit